MTQQTLISLKNITKHFDISGGFLDQLRLKNGKITREHSLVHAVNNISFDITKGETISVVGESGSGKSTLARVVMNLYRPNGGEIHYKDQRIDNLPPAKFMPYRTKMQMVFQDPYASLNPRMRVKNILEEPVRFHFPNLNPMEVKMRVAEVMEQVGISASWGVRFPHEFSGGQRQRISLARALVVGPEFIAADEPISALDVSIQAQVLNLMMDMQESHNLTYMFISHDLSVVRHISNRVAVMYLGTLCELADSAELFKNPRHPYTQVLLSAIPEVGHKPDQRLKLVGEIPTPINLPPGCVFHGRCPHAFERCSQQVPVGRMVEGGTMVACHAVEEGRI
ncbi:ATP-binding cassette domain-containing protein [Desulfovibrio sp. OttesenSCG-928-F07]|nr:ATP-binding cassette domain-containing protein [Desulfovibrio sp. OttesenSCG-928-F07]